MGKLIYAMFASLDGYVADEQGRFEWAAPDEEVHRFANEFERPVLTHLYGRRMYETMAVWDDPAAFADEPAVVQEYGESWRAADKVVYSATLKDVGTRRTRLEHAFAAQDVRRIKEAADHDVSIGGPTLAGHALRAGLVDELCLFTVPVVIGGGMPWLPDGVRLRLDLLAERRFTAGVVYSRYRVAGGMDLQPSGE